MENVIQLVVHDGDPNRILHALLAQPDQLEDVARVAADTLVLPHARLAALRGVVEAVSVLDAALPAPIATAIADPQLIDAAIEQKKTNPIIAAIHQLAKRADVRDLRTSAICKLIAARVRGINLAWLAIEIGDHDSAVTLALIDFDENLAERFTNPNDPVISAWLAFVVDAPEPVRREFLAAFGDRKDALLSHLRPEQRARLFPPKRTFDLRTLSRAASSGDLAIIREHLDGGGDPNAGEARSGTVILHDAAFFKQAEIVKALLAAGANPRARNSDGREPLQLAIEFPPSGPIAMVIGGSFTVMTTPEARRDRAGQIAIVNMLLDSGASPNPEISNAILFSLPLDAAATLGDLQIVKILLARGADPNRGAPLVEAVNHGHAEVVTALLEAGANPNQRQRGGATALLRSVDALDVVLHDDESAAQRRGEAFGDANKNLVRMRMRIITKLLLCAGADRSLGDERGRTPLASASRGTDARLVQLLTPKTAESARHIMLTEIGNAHAAAKMYESAGVGDPRTTGALGVVWSTIHTYAPNPSEPAATYAERMVAWSREMLARHGLAAAEDAFAMIRDAAI